MENKGYFRWAKFDVWLLLILAAAAALRLFRIGLQDPWLDELSSLQVSDPSLTFSQTHQLIMTREGFPHLYFLSLKWLSAVFGHSIVTLRLFSAVFGIASVALVFGVLKRMFNRNTGYVGALLLASNTFHIYHSQEGRCYALFVFFVLLATYTFLGYIKNPTYRNAIFLGLSAGLIPNAHPIGLLNTGVIYAALAVFFFITKDKKKLFWQVFVAVLCTILVFLPVYPLIARISKITSFWIPAASFDNVRQAFLELAGGLGPILWLYVASIFLFFAFYIAGTVREKKKEEKRFRIVILFLVFFWLTLTAGVIIAKSFLGDVSLILNRYFIGVLAAFIVTAAYSLSLLRNRIAILVCAIGISAYSVYTLEARNYYSSVSKTEWVKLADDIIARNSHYHRLYSAYGFTSNILFKGTPNYRRMKEILFDDYLFAVRNGSLQKEPFWYFDGNFRPYTLSAENEAFLKSNYEEVERIDKYDCWARHYIPKGVKLEEKANGSALFLDDFQPAVLDNEGHLLLFQNGVTQTDPRRLIAGNYRFEMEANSLPNPPIGGKNAHITVHFGDRKIGDVTLSEKENNKKYVFPFKVSDSGLQRFAISYDNDFATDAADRNVIIYAIRLIRVGR